MIETIFGLLIWAVIIGAAYSLGKMRGISKANRAYHKTLEAMWEGKIT